MKKKILAMIILFSFIFLFSVNSLLAGWWYSDYDSDAACDAGGNSLSTITKLYVDDNYPKHIYVKVQSTSNGPIPGGVLKWYSYKDGVKFNTRTEYFGCFGYQYTHYPETWLNNATDWLYVATLTTRATASFPFLSTLETANYVRTEWH